jgi:hypothetical protein
MPPLIANGRRPFASADSARFALSRQPRPRFSPSFPISADRVDRIAQRALFFLAAETIRNEICLFARMATAQVEAKSLNIR